MQFLLDLRDHPNLEKGYDNYKKGKETFEERRKFLMGQFENLKKDFEKYDDDFMGLVHTYITEPANKIRLPEGFSKTSHCVHLQGEGEHQLFCHKKEDHDSEHPLVQIFKILGKGPPPDGKT